MPITHTLHSDKPIPENEKAVTKTFRGAGSAYSPFGPA